MHHVHCRGLKLLRAAKGRVDGPARSTTLVEVEANNDVPIAVIVWIKDATTQRKKKLQRLARIAISADSGEVTAPSVY